MRDWWDALVVGFVGWVATSYRHESKELCFRGATSASRRKRANRLAHQTAPRRGGAQLEVCTSAAADAAEAQTTHSLGLGSFSVVLGAMRSTRCARQPQYSNGRQAAAS